MKNREKSAFPFGEKYVTKDLVGHTTQHRKGALDEGMTLRDYFASKALQGIRSSHEILRAMAMDRKNCARNEDDTTDDYIAQECYRQADAMLKEREL